MQFDKKLAYFVSRLIFLMMFLFILHKTAIHFAVEKGYIEIAKMLMENGANTKSKVNA